MARVKKLAAPQGRVIVFIDESGLSARPPRGTWAPKGETPIHQYRFSWKQLSVIAAIGYWRFHFSLFNVSLKYPQIVEILKALQATIAKKLLIIWDGLQAHGSKLVRAHVEDQRGRIVLERLPAYAAEMNPVDCIWSYLRHHATPNYCATHFTALAQCAWRNLRPIQRPAMLVTALWKQAELF